MKSFVLSVFTSVLLITSCSKEDANTEIIQIQSVYPVLKSKDFINILQSQVIINDTLQITNIRKLLFSTGGTTNIADIESANLFYTGDKDEFINEKSVLFSETSEISNEGPDNGNTRPEKYQLSLDEGRGNGYSCLTGVDNDHIGI